MLCKDCKRQIYESLNNDDLMILYYIYAKEKLVNGSVQNEEARKYINIFSSSFVVSIATGFSLPKVNTILYMLMKIHALQRSKIDHSWNYSLGENGNDFIAMLHEDKNKEKLITELLKGGKK